MLIRGVWIVNRVIGVGCCNALEYKVAQSVFGGEYMPSMDTEILCLTS